jgi:hypothetical protein
MNLIFRSEEHAQNSARSMSEPASLPVLGEPASAQAFKCMFTVKKTFNLNPASGTQLMSPGRET